MIRWGVLVAAALFVSGYVTGSLPIGLHFTLGEAIKTTKASSWRNMPGPAALVRMVMFACRCLDPIRIAAGKPVHINSWFRSEYVNGLTPGAVDDSFHMKGNAADIYIEGMTSQELADFIDGLGVPYTELGVYLASNTGRVHIAYDGNNTRERYTSQGA